MRGPRRAAPLAVAVLMLFSSLSRAGEGWVDAGAKNGVVYEKRAVSGSKFLEYRATTQIALAPTQAQQIIWKVITEMPPSDVMSRRVLASAADEVVVYDRIHTPVVSDRDTVMRFSKVVRPDELEVRFESTSALGPPPDPKYVRLPVVRGAWTLVAVPGGSRLTYVCYSEPGGSVPAFVIRGAMRDHVAIDVERMLAHLRADRAADALQDERHRR